MEIISTGEFNSICHDSQTKVLKFGKVDQPKVFEHHGTTIIKLFYAKKRKFSSDRIRPRAMRFYKNVKALHDRGYGVPRVNKIQFCPELKIYLLYYQKIQGKDVRSIANAGQMTVVKEVAHLLADLHNKGVFFRSIHLENLLYEPQQKFSLLDVTDVRFRIKPLSLALRYRNLKHLFREPYDKDIWRAFGIDNFMDEYFRCAKMTKYAERILKFLIKKIQSH